MIFTKKNMTSLANSWPVHGQMMAIYKHPHTRILFVLNPVKSQMAVKWPQNGRRMAAEWPVT